jgi:DNA (cytosine-5)-methyltransferase 1
MNGEGLEEELALIDDKLSGLTAELQETEMFDGAERPQYKLTDFTVFDELGHMCRFDTGLLEKDIAIYISGTIKTIWDENPLPEGGVKVAPFIITQWWSGGFDGGHNTLLGISSPIAEYYLMLPAKEYSTLYDKVLEKNFLIKVTIEYLSDNTEATFEELLAKLQNMSPPSASIPRITLETVLQHSQFLIDQAFSYDDAADDDEFKVMETPCMKYLAKLAGFTVTRQMKLLQDSRKQNGIRRKKQIKVDTKATATPLVKQIFEDFFAAQIQGGNIAKKRSRCFKCSTCVVPDCGVCVYCKDMKKYGGPGIKKQSCMVRFGSAIVCNFLLGQTSLFE